MFEFLRRIPFLTMGAFALHPPQNNSAPELSLKHNKSHFIHYIGEVSKHSGHLRARKANSLVWHNLAEIKRKISSGDALLTTRDGQAEFKFKSGEIVELLPNTLIIFRELQSKSGKIKKLKQHFSHQKLNLAFALKLQRRWQTVQNALYLHPLPTGHCRA